MSTLRRIRSPLGAPRGRANCTDLGYCSREALKVPRGERYELCRSVHAEANAIISASRRDMVGGTLYLVGRNAQTGELLIRCVITAPYVEIWDGSTNFRLTVPGTGFARVSCA